MSSAVWMLNTLIYVRGTLHLVNKMGTQNIQRRPTEFLLSLLNMNSTLEMREKTHFLPSRLPALCDGQQKRQNFMVLEFTGLESFLGKGQM